METTPSSPGRDQSWESVRPPWAHCLVATLSWMALGWLVRDEFLVWLGGIFLFILWMGVGLLASVHAVRAYFWARDPGSRLVAALVVPVALAVQILILWR